jgi:isopenicillin N synthase-like dioxygenase
VHLVEEAFGIPTGTFDAFFTHPTSGKGIEHQYLPPQHRIKLLKYPPSPQRDGNVQGQGVGAHKDSSGWLTFLYQVGEEEGLEVLDSGGEWLLAPPIQDTFVVNFGNAFEAATQGAVKATVHRVKVCSKTSV